MPLSPEGLFAVREWVGTTPDDDALNAIFTQSGDHHDRTVLYVLNQRLASLASSPSSVTVPGLSISHSTDFEALKMLIQRFKDGGGTGLDEETDVVGVGLSSIRRDFAR